MNKSMVGQIAASKSPRSRILLRKWTSHPRCWYLELLEVEMEVEMEVVKVEEMEVEMEVVKVEEMEVVKVEEMEVEMEVEMEEGTAVAEVPEIQTRHSQHSTRWMPSSMLH